MAEAADGRGVEGRPPALTADVLRRGVDAPPPERIALRAGPVRAVLEGIDLREVGPAGSVLLDRVYVAVRDRDWNTIPVVVSGLEVDRRAESFRVSFRARHQDGDIDFEWQGAIVGEPDGVIRFTMSGASRAAFQYCRIGFCVLHPDALAGSRYEARTPAGPVAGTLPRLVAPQTIVDGFERPLFPACEALKVVGRGGLSVTTEFSGDLFEMEDQRNWTDASFKTYCTPIGLGYPHDAKPGQTIDQGVTIRFGGSPTDDPGAEPASSGDEVAMTLSAGLECPLPAIGLVLGSEGAGSSDRERDLLRDLHLDHLRVDVRPSSDDWRSRLEAGIEAARQLGSSLEIALFVPREREAAIAQAAIARVADTLADAPVSRWLVFDEASAGTGTTPPGLAAQVREAIDERQAGVGRRAVVVAGGTDGDFAELNRALPDLRGLEALTYAINPQVHASDDRSILENVTAQGVTVETARSHADGRQISISPVTLAPRFNPAAGGSQKGRAEGALPASVDVRQMSLLGAAWTVGSIASLAAACASSITYYETLGWRGLIERAAGSRLPDRFVSEPGMVFPVYHVLAGLADMRPGRRLTLASPMPRTVAGIAVQRDGRVIGMLANLTPEPIRASIGPVEGGLRLRILDETTALAASRDPQAFGASSEDVSADGSRVRLALLPYATAFFEAERGPRPT